MMGLIARPPDLTPCLSQWSLAIIMCTCGVCAPESSSNLQYNSTSNICKAITIIIHVQCTRLINNLYPFLDYVERRAVGDAGAIYIDQPQEPVQSCCN